MLFPAQNKTIYSQNQGTHQDELQTIKQNLEGLDYLSSQQLE